jgi:hypothetical protein
MKVRIALLAFLLALVFAAPGALWATSSVQKTFATKYGLQGTALDACKTCHTSGSNFNKYGAAINRKRATGLTVARSLTRVQRLDSDKDTFTNIQEIKAGTFPGNAKSKPAAAAVAALQSNVQARAKAVNTYSQNDYTSLTFDQVGPNDYRYANVKADQVVLGQTGGYTDEDGEAVGGMEVAFPLGAWETVDVEVLDTGTVNIYVDGSTEPYASYDF